jgi:hypothetical protein
MGQFVKHDNVKITRDLGLATLARGPYRVHILGTRVDVELNLPTKTLRSRREKSTHLIVAWISIRRDGKLCFSLKKTQF